MSPSSGLLRGKRILITRRAEQAAVLTKGLADEGATVLEVPLIEVVPPADPGPLDRALASLAGYDWLAFTSANAVEGLALRRAALGMAGPLPARLAVACAGSSTADVFRSRFPLHEVAVVPRTDYGGEGLLRALAGQKVEGRRFLVPASDRARDAFARGLRARGAEVDVVTAYRTGAPAGAVVALRTALEEGVDVVTFASPSAVEHFRSVLPGLSPDSLPPAAVIGPVTEEAARAAGLTVVVVARPSTAEGLLAALRRHFAPASARPS